jgi:hypothetical protein
VLGCVGIEFRAGVGCGVRARHGIDVGTSLKLQIV